MSLRALTCLAAASLGLAWIASPASAASGCVLSKTGPGVVPGRPSFNVGGRFLAVSLSPGAQFVAVPEGRPGRAFVQPNGTIRTKVGWWSPRGTPRVTGRRLDAPAPPLDARIGVKSVVLGAGEFYPSYLFFPTVGCWRVTARNASTRLDFTVRVLRR